MPLVIRSTNMASQFYHLLLLFASLLGHSFGSTVAPASTEPPAPLRLTLTIHTVDSQAPVLGEYLTMQCNVWNRHDDRQATVWYKNTEFFATSGALQGRTMDSARTSMVRSVIEGNLEVDTLTIAQLLPEDLANYTCQLWQFHTDGVESLILLSQSINVQAQGVPILNTPECSPIASPVWVPSGDVIALECHVDLVDSMISHNLYWTGGETNQIYVGVTAIDSATHTAKMVLNFIMKEDYQNTTFVCHVNQTNGDAVHYRTCTVGPFFLMLDSNPTITKMVVPSSLLTTIPLRTQPLKTTRKSPPRNKNDKTSTGSPFDGYIFIIIVLAAMLILFCGSCFACWLCCCRKTRHGRYSFRSRLNSRRKLVKSTSAANSEMEMPNSPQRRNIPAEFESPYYSSVGSGGVKLPYADRSAADGASYTALQKTGNNSNSTIVERPRASSAADILDEEGYNVVGIGTLGLSKDASKSESTKDFSKSESTKNPKDFQSDNSPSWSSSLRRGFSLNSLSRRSGSRSRPVTPVGTPVDEAMPVYKTLMRPDVTESKTPETPYYLSVFPPSLNKPTPQPADSFYEVQETPGVRSSTVPKSHGGVARNIDRKGENRKTTPAACKTENAKVGDDGYLCPTPPPSTLNQKPKLSSNVSDPRFSNAMYNVF